MKIIDEKGRLFGWINLLDLVVLVTILAVLFVGLSAWLALRKPVVTLAQYSPTEITAGSAQIIRIKIVNENYLVNTRFFLTPSSYQGSTLVYEGEAMPNVRDSVFVSLPADIPPGKYTARLEVETMNVFQRVTKTTLAFPAEIAFNEGQQVQQVQVGPVFDNSCRWQLGFTAFLTYGIEGQDTLATGDTLVDYSGAMYTITRIQESVDSELLKSIDHDLQKKVSRQVRLSVTTDYDSLFSFFASSGSLLRLASGENQYAMAPAGKITVSLDMLFYLNQQQQIGLLEDSILLVEQGGNARGLVVHNFGDVDNAWVKKTSVVPDDQFPRAFEVARVNLQCDLKADGLYFGRFQLEPYRLLAFKAGGTSITGGILSNRQPAFNLVVRVLVDAFPVQLEQLLAPGMPVTDASGTRRLGTLKRIVAVDAISNPLLILANMQSSYSQLFKRMVLDLETTCQLVNGRPVCNGQPLEFGQNFAFSLLGTPLTSMIRYDSSLPPRSISSQDSLQVEFRSVPPELVAWIRAGEQEYSPNGPSTWKILRIISNQPSRMGAPVAVPGQGLVIEHPVYRDIRCLVELNTFKSGSDVYFGGSLLRIGSGITFNASKWTHQAILVSF